MCFNASAPLRAESTTSELPPLRGFRMYSDPWRTGHEKYGFCEIPTDGSTTIIELTEGQADLKFTSGGALTDNGYLGFEHQQLPSGEPLQSIWHRYDPVTFEEINSGAFDFFFSAPSLAYEPVSGLIYCCVADFTTGGFFFGSLDPATMQLTYIANIGEFFWFSMVADGQGGLYAVDFDSVLLKVNPADGTTTEIGPMGLLTYTNSSMAVDPTSGRCFWTVTPPSTFMGSLYEVDLATGDATPVCVFPDADEFTGIYFDVRDDDSKAPGVPQNFKAEFANGSLSGKLVFTVPDAPEGVDGTEVEYIINSTDGQTLRGTAAYGATAEQPVAVDESGDYTFSLQLTNEHGTSPLVKCSMWIGLDMPEPIAKPETTVDGKTVTISWQHPSVTIHNRLPVDPAAMSYRVERMPGNVLVADTNSTSVTDTPDVTDDDMTPYQYAVTAIFITGTTATGTEPVLSAPIVFGTASLPYFNDFADEGMMAHFTVVDANGDGATWMYSKESGAAYSTYGNWTSKDDWLISPPFAFEEDKNYILSVDVAGMGDYNPETMEIVLLSDATAANPVKTILERTEVTNSIFNGYRTIEARFTSSSSARYYVGIHAMGNESSYYLYVDNFRLSAGIDSNAPAVPSDVTVVAAEDGASSADISGNAPTTTYTGAALSGTVDIAIYRDGELATTVSAVAPGAEFKVTDTPSSGRHVYRVLATNSYGGGEACEIVAFVGVSAPKAPGNVEMYEDSELLGLVHLSWEAPTEDTTGHPVDQASLRYAILDLYGNVVAENIEECSYMVDALPMGVERMFTRFVIYAVNEVGVSPVPAYTNIIPIGYPYENEWKESFADGNVSTMIGSEAANIGDDVVWMPAADSATITAADGDNGYVAMHAATLGLTADLLTPKCFVKQNDYLAFAWHGTPESTNTLKIYAVADRQNEPIGEIAVGSATGWQATQIDLDNYIGKDVYFIFRGAAVSHNDIYLDCLSVDATSGIGNIGDIAKQMTVRSGEGWLAVSGTAGNPVRIYTADGRVAATVTNADGRKIALSASVYIVRCGATSAKAVVR